jgi:hypothetical protein
VLTHSAPHAVSPPGQEQVPPEQIAPGGQGALHAPQCWRLTVVSTQIPLHDASGPAQPHEPLVQELPPVQVCPHPPQCALQV